MRFPGSGITDVVASSTPPWATAARSGRTSASAAICSRESAGRSARVETPRGRPGCGAPAGSRDGPRRRHLRDAAPDVGPARGRNGRARGADRRQRQGRAAAPGGDRDPHGGDPARRALREAGQSLTLAQLDRGRRFEIAPDAGTYVEQTFADGRQRRETALAAAEKALGIDAVEAPPALPVSVDRTGERLRVHGRDCERVVLRSTRETVVVAGRGAPEASTTPSRFAMTFDLCLTPAARAVAEAQALEARIGDLTGERGPTLDRELRVFARRRDVFAVFELMHRLLE